MFWRWLCAATKTFALPAIISLCYVPFAEGSPNNIYDEPVQIVELPIQIVDSSNHPIQGVKVVPWALGWAQGHGFWGSYDGKPDQSGIDPMPVYSDAHGIAKIKYPYYRDAGEKTRTSIVSVAFEHDVYSHEDVEHIDVPMATGATHKVVMLASSSINVLPIIDNQKVALDDLFALSSSQKRSQNNGITEKTSTGRLRMDRFHPGLNRLYVIRMIGDEITHFIKCQKVDVKEGIVHELTVPLLPPAQLKGKLSNNVPRPVRHGRVIVRTFPEEMHWEQMLWLDWTSIAEDGTFVFNAWPAGERIQIIALCDGYIATSGSSQSKEPQDPQDRRHRPHIFEVGHAEIEIPMMPLASVTITVTDANKMPISGLDVSASPNVHWWDNIAQIYAGKLTQGEKRIRDSNYRGSKEGNFPDPFRGKTNSHGSVTFQLPPGIQCFDIVSDQYEFPVDLGERSPRHIIEMGQPLSIALQVQKKGTEHLGDWDKLAGIVFGCSTEEGQKFLKLPGMHDKIDSFVKRFRDAKNQKDPALLADAYLILADALFSAGDKEEALKWRQKSKELRQKQ
ncbi:MAG: tetratricopeptide repeat protein [Pirellulales bacterium]